MANRLDEEEVNLIKKAYVSGEDKLDKKELSKFEYAKTKPVTADDVMNLVDLKYPTPTDEEMEFVKKFIASAGTLKLTPHEVDLLNAAANKRVSLQDVVGVVMEAYRNDLAKRYGQLNELVFNLQIILRDELASVSKIKSLANKLHESGDLTDEGLAIVKKQNLRMSKHDYAEAKKATEDAMNKVVDKMNDATAALDKVAKEQSASK